MKLDRPSVPELTNELERKAQKNKKGEPIYSTNDFRMVARTELNSMRAVNALLSFQEAGIKRYRYSAKIDSRTSPICRKLNNKTYWVSVGLKNEKFRPSVHPNCRSRVVPAGF